MLAEKIIPVAAQVIPKQLQQIDRWAPWRYVLNKPRTERAGHEIYDKVPCRADNPRYGLSTAKPEQWFTFDAAMRVVERDPKGFAGVGFCITGHKGLVMIDLDDCVIDGSIEPWAQEIIDQVDSYTEFSPSGQGLRIVVAGNVPYDWMNHDVGIEVYGGHQNRFLTITGDHLLLAPGQINTASGELLQGLASKYAKERMATQVADQAMPELLDEIMLPDPTTLGLPKAASDFLERGTVGEDRSGTLHAAGIALYAVGLDDATVFSILANNDYAMEIAMDHRRQDADRALLYLWREHCIKAKAKGQEVVASPDEFETVQAPKGEVKLPPFARDKHGFILATLSNLSMALSCEAVCGMTIGLDVFRDEIMFVAKGTGVWATWGDADSVRLRKHLEDGGFKPIGRELMRDAVLLAADNNKFDSASDWLNGLQWDGVNRIDRFYQDYFGVEDNDYATAVGAYTWTALAGRVLEPGCKADMVPVLVGPQGLGKTASVEAISPHQDFFAEIDLGTRDDDLSRRMRGCLVAEIGELRGLHSRDAESIKSFITRTHEHWVPKFKEFATKFPRRVLFFGTTNQDQFLSDPTGNRRWLPLEVTRTDRQAIAEIRDQLWAEGAARFKVSGIEFKQAEDLGREQHEQFEIRDVWEDQIKKWLNEPDLLTGVKPCDREFLLGSDVLTEALGFKMQNVARKEEMRIGAVLRALGYTRKKLRISKKLTWGFFNER